MTDVMKASRVRFAVERLGYTLVDWDKHPTEDHLGAAIGRRNQPHPDSPGNLAVWTVNFSHADPQILVHGHYDIPTLDEANASLMRKLR